MAMPNRCCICKTDTSFEWVGIRLGNSDSSNRKLVIEKLGWYDKGDELMCKRCAIELLQRLAAIFRCSITIHCLCECNISYDRSEIKKCAGDATPCW